MAVWAPCHGFCHDLDGSSITIPLPPSCGLGNHTCVFLRHRGTAHSNGLGVFCGPWPSRRLFHMAFYHFLPSVQHVMTQNCLAKVGTGVLGSWSALFPPEMMTSALRDLVALTALFSVQNLVHDLVGLCASPQGELGLCFGHFQTEKRLPFLSQDLIPPTFFCRQRTFVSPVDALSLTRVVHSHASQDRRFGKGSCQGHLGP